jgi:hypothetical protein
MWKERRRIVKVAVGCRPCPGQLNRTPPLSSSPLFPRLSGPTLGVGVTHKAVGVDNEKLELVRASAESLDQKERAR